MKWLCWLGTLAYGIYLFHTGVQYLLFGLIWGRGATITGIPTFLVTLAAMALTLLLAALSWRYFEQPLIRMGRRTNFEFGAARDAGNASLWSKISLSMSSAVIHGEGLGKQFQRGHEK